MVAKAQPLFDLGQVLATPGALDSLNDAGDDLGTFLRRHHTGDWGDVDSEDWSLNDAALQDGSRLLSAYKTRKGVKFWIITEAKDDQGRRVATLLLPDEY